mgnify:CR=1 FL=1
MEQQDTYYTFAESASDFFQYLGKYGGVNSHTRTNYISWMTFLSHYHTIDNSITTETIEEIMRIERGAKDNRTIYTKDKDMTNFTSALRKFMSFVLFNYQEECSKQDEEEVKRINQNKSIKETVKKAIIQSRVGQGEFRDDLIRYWHGCSISTFNKTDVLIASHIKPWRDSNDKERLDLFNGLLLLPNYDKLFDKGYISFDSSGKILYSRYITDKDKQILNMDDSMHLLRIEDNHRHYLEYHNEHCFMD